MISKHRGLRGRLAALCVAAFVVPHAASAHSLGYAVNTVNWSFVGAPRNVDAPGNAPVCR